MSINDTAKIRLLTNKLKTGQITEAQAKNMLHQLETEGTDSSINRGKIKVLTNHLKGVPSAITFIPKQMDFAKGGDEHVARKYLQLKDNALTRGINFSLTLEDVRTVLNATRCAYSGVWFDKAPNGDKLTFDRVDNTKGYEPGNVVACLESINRLKNELLEQTGAPFYGNYSGLLECVRRWGGVNG